MRSWVYIVIAREAGCGDILKAQVVTTIPEWMASEQAGGHADALVIAYVESGAIGPGPKGTVSDFWDIMVRGLWDWETSSYVDPPGRLWVKDWAGGC